MIKDTPLLGTGLSAGGAPAMWQQVLADFLPGMRYHLPSGSKVLELGYGDGVLTCYLSQNLGWNITGLDVDAKAQIAANNNAIKYNARDQVSFCLCKPEEVLKYKGSYDAVFIKTVLYGSETTQEYGRRLDWILSVIKPGGFLINFETGRSNRLVQLYRKLRRRIYTDLCLYTREIESLYDSRFEILQRNYYGGLSQFLAPVPKLYSLACRLEEAIRERDADSCFAVGMIARKHPSR